MNIVKTQNLACPIDGELLEFRDKLLICCNGHAFDIARSGYVNLLPVQHKRSKHPGDSKEMVLARTQFLNSGKYESIAQKLAEIAFTQIPKGKEVCVLDAGCGEGYYVDYVFNNLKLKNGSHNLSFVGLDISKAAIAAAAKRNKLITWVVGTNKQPPVTPASVDVILCVFGFHSFDGFDRIMKPGAKVILVEPGPDHLLELRVMIYTKVEKSDPEDLSYLEEKGFSMVDYQRLNFKTGEINNDQINNLLAMTPHFFKASRERRKTVASLDKLNLTVDVVIRTFEKL